MGRLIAKGYHCSGNKVLRMNSNFEPLIYMVEEQTTSYFSISSLLSIIYISITDFELIPYCDSFRQVLLAENKIYYSNFSFEQMR